MPSSEPDSNPVTAPRCWAEIDAAALRHNVAVLGELAGPDCGLMAIVKADAYGHGLTRTGAILAKAGVRRFGVANVGEALELADAVPAGSCDGILVLSPIADEMERRIVTERGFAATVSSVEEVEAFAAAAAGGPLAAKLHAVVDTGMGRMGCDPAGFASLAGMIRDADGVALAGVATHFPSADEDPEFTRKQVAAFRGLLDEADLPEDCQVHLANSAGLIGFPGEMDFATLARPGLAIFGVSPFPRNDPPAGLRPVLSWKTRVTLVRKLRAGSSVSYGRTFVAPEEMRVASLAAGYADGYPRHVSGNGAEVLVGGRRCPVLGRVTMDQIVVDVGDGDEIRAGDEAVLLGTQGDETISAWELAGWAGTIPWEILTGLSNRVRRVYRG